ncbi:MAG TPA: AAA family ATPase [Gemmatimonadaceae bacterium]|nr:AAA family ATPase [Gemmatimonadaceae bacterium]
MVELRMLAKAEIQTQAGTITPAQQMLFAAALYVLLSRGKPVSRQRLAILLWPQADRSSRAHRLRQTLHQLKRSGVPLGTNRISVWLSPTLGRIDLDMFGKSNQHEDTEKDSIEILPGYEPEFSAEFHDWIDRIRGEAQSDLARVLLPKLAAARSGGNWVEVERLATQCLTLDPYHEPAVLARAESLAMRGHKAAAVSVLNRFAEEVSPRVDSLVLPAATLRRRILQAEDRPLSATGVNDPEFVGRGAEMKQLLGLLDRAQSGIGGGCLLIGDPGIGKTRLSSELAKFARLQGFEVARVSCKRADVDQPLSAFVSLVPILRELPGALGCCGETMAWLTRLTEFNNLPQAQPSSSDDSSALYTHLRTAVFDLLDAVSEENRILFIIEDIQWLDRASARLFATILEWSAKRRLLCVFNGRENCPYPLEGSSPVSFPIISIPPLEPCDAATMIRGLAHGNSDLTHSSGASWLAAVAEGNPYFLQELIKHQLESGQRETVPPSIAAVLGERLSRLSDVAHQLLQACAVLTENSSIERLEKVLDYAPYQLLKGIQELSVAGMLRAPAAVDSGPNVLLVRHDLLSIQVLSTLTASALAYLHRRCALILEREAVGASASVSLVRACTFHWHRSGESERAYGLALKCANHLLELGLAVDAELAFESALRFTGSPANRLEVLRRVVQANRMAHNQPGVLRTIARIRAMQSPGGASHHDELEILEFDALKTTEKNLEKLFARTLDCVRDASLSSAHRVEAAGVAAKLASGLPELGELAKMYRVVRPLLQDATVPARSILHLQVIYETMCGDLRRAAKIAKQRLQLERREGTVSSILAAMGDLAFVLSRSGPNEEMFVVLRDAYATAVRHNHYAAARQYAERIGSLIEDNQGPDASEWMRLAAECKGDRPELRTSFSFNADSVRIALREGRLEDARHLLDTGFDWEWLGQRRIWMVVATGLAIRLLIAERAPKNEVEREVTRMLALTAFTAILGRQDYEIVGLVQGLVYIDRRATAERVLEEYLGRQRRDLTPLTKELSSIVDTWGIAVKRDAQSRTRRQAHSRSTVATV